MGAGQVHLGQVDLGQGQQGVQDGENVVHAAQVQVEPRAPDFKGRGQRRRPGVEQGQPGLVLAQVHQGVDVRLGDLRVQAVQQGQRLHRVPVRAQSGLGQPEVLQKGRVIPSRFHRQEGAGVFGEAGPEAIMPLQRGPDGRLGVAAHGGGGSGGGVGVSIRIDNNGGKEVTTNESMLQQFGNEIGQFVERKYRELQSRDLKAGGVLSRSAM